MRGWSGLGGVQRGNRRPLLLVSARWVCLLVSAWVAASCQPTPAPTLAALATVPPARPTQPIVTWDRSEPSPTWTLTPAPTRTPLPTPTRFPTRTPFPSRTPTGTPPPTETPSVTPIPLPTETVAATPFSTPDSGLAPVGRSGSKLGLHVIRNNSPGIMEFVRRAKPAVIKAVDDLGWLTEVKQASPDTVTVGRLSVSSQDMVGDPKTAASRLVQEQLATYLLNPGVDYWEGWNEADPDEQMRWYADFEAERVRLLAQHGLRAAVGGFATGVPELDQYYLFLPALEAARRYGGILSLHEYAAPTLDYLYGDPLPGYPTYRDRGPLALRYRWLYQDILIPRGTVLPLVISEAGIDGIVMSGERSGPTGLGWQDFRSYWEREGLGSGAGAYIRQLAWYDAEMQQDWYAIGFTVFTAGGGSRWSSYDVNSILPEITEYVVQNR